jgi:hypothetical protein
MFDIRQDDLSGTATRDHSPAGSVFALDLSGLRGPAVAFPDRAGPTVQKFFASFFKKEALVPLLLR